MTETQQDEQPKADSEHQERSRPDCSRPGELLRKAREAQGLTQAEVAKQLNFLPVYVPSLENEKFDVLHNKTFIKGYMRAYARFLKIDAEEVLRCFSEHHPELENQERIQPVEGIKPPKSRNLVFKIFTLLIVLTLIAVIILWWQSRNLEPLPSLTNQDVQVDTLDGDTISAPMGQAEEERSAKAAEQLDSQPETSTPIMELRSQEEPRQLEALPEEENTQVTEVQPVEPTQNEAPPAPEARSFSGDPAEITAGNSSLVALRFSDDCWTEVRDQQDRVLHANLNRAGDTLLLEGDAPFRMVFGQGSAVEVYYQGEALDFAHRIRPNGYASITVE
jgi:cytoskeleton protein RodZ